VTDKDLPSDLIIFMQQIGILAPVKIDKRVPVSRHDTSVWRPAYIGEEPPF
jgi:hypothetical protein